MPDDTGFATLAFSVIAAEPAASSELIAATLGKTLLPRPLQEATYLAAGLLFPPDDPGSLTTADTSGETEGSVVGDRSAGDVFGSGLLPEVLRIGGGAGGVNPTQSPDGDSDGPDGGES
jgi:hypothetical protein